MKKFKLVFFLLGLLNFSIAFAEEANTDETANTGETAKVAETEASQEEAKIKNFLGGSIAYEFGHFKTTTGASNLVQDAKMNPLGFSGFYALTYKNLLTTFEVNHKEDNDARLKTGSIPTSFRNTFGTIRFDYLHGVGKIKKNSGLFIGGGLGYGAIDISQQNTASALDQYFVLTMDYGWMQTFEDINLMYNIVFKHNYGWQTNASSIKLEKMYVSQFSFGLAYAF